MNKFDYLIITSISDSENKVLQNFAQQSKEHNFGFIVIGDTKSPVEFIKLANCDFYSIQRQKMLDFSLVQQLPERHYARKNIGYLLAVQAGAEIIVESDDDNYPCADFWHLREEMVDVNLYQNSSWINVYKLFTESHCWPRGFSLAHIQKDLPKIAATQHCRCPIQQGLADENPDVDAIFRLINPLPLSFDASPDVAIGRGSWCPFNSQNTTWFKDAFPLMYLPSFCSFRMTDIWRSFVVQRICWENDWNILFTHPTVWQIRNEHNLMGDFADEIPGYLYNHLITENLEKLELKAGRENLGENLLLCYECLIQMSLIEPEEIKLIEAWNHDLSVMKLMNPNK